MIRASWGGGLTSTAERFREAQRKADVLAARFVSETSMNVIADAMRNFEGSHSKGHPRVPNGSPGKPNIVTGTLRRSIRGSGLTKFGAGKYTNTVGPSTIYGRRVEMGFRGQDSRGRTYDQPAYPFFGPAVKKNRTIAQNTAFELFSWANLLS